MKLLRKLLLPIVPIYYLVTSLRNTLYNVGAKSSTSYDFPVICVGNLSVGGTGKTPMIEYLIRLLKSNYHLATLSRGYKRKSVGFVLADTEANPSTIGDEPFQIYNKFDDIIVSVDADRRHGIEQLRALEITPEVILLDDAFQHRRVEAGLNILLTAFDNLYSDDIVLPTGNLREPKSGANRADVIVVTKCPDQLADAAKKNVIKQLDPITGQEVFFSHIGYSEKIIGLNEEKELGDLKASQFTLVTGIANSKPLVDFLNAKGLNFEHLNYKDHHEFSENEIENLKTKTLVLTTEKDFVRLESDFKNSNTLFYLPIEVIIDRSFEFNNLISGFCKFSK
ncbi:tetraacyldisaccharide 4'-kinase [Flavobacteriales bacterium 34_180_T64]|nr:tetraacyldisaccharide 4'-kinase [Flavobacteriales bacterium 34_180_T64]